MYDPVKDGVEKSAGPVTYVEVDPPDDLAQIVHCYWQLKSEEVLQEDFMLHALPDACVNVLFDQVNLEIAGVTALHTSHTTLNLGTSFHYVGIQLFPGVWASAFEGTVDHYVGERYDGELPLLEVNRSVDGLALEDQSSLFSQLVRDLVTAGVVAPNWVTAEILAKLDEISSVADMATAVGLSPRQLQRTLNETTGFSPHDLLKVLRLQHSFRRDYLLAFADQAHYTHSFKRITGYTPAAFRKRFDV